MRLEKCKDSHGIVVQCVKCGGLRPLSRCYADLDGVAFVDYYCLECVNEIENKSEKDKS